MAITITEKEHWKNRIEAKIDKRIDKLKLSDPELFRSVRQPAQEAALKTLKITKEFAKLSKLEEQIAALETQEKEQVSIVYEILSGRHSTGYGIRGEITSIIEKQQERQEEELLLSHDTGREIATLREEKENLLDTVWLATSPRQVTELWQNLSKLIGDEATGFQKEVLSKRAKTKKT